MEGNNTIETTVKVTWTPPAILEIDKALILGGAPAGGDGGTQET